MLRTCSGMRLTAIVDSARLWGVSNATPYSAGIVVKRKKTFHLLPGTDSRFSASPDLAGTKFKD